MRQDKIYEDLEFLNDYSVENWNDLIKSKLEKYFPNKTIFEKNIEILRTEIRNHIVLSQKSIYLELFEWTHELYAECITINKEETLKIFAESFQVISKTDMTWIANVLTQPDHTLFSERDKISYYFKVIDDTLEGVYKPRLKLLDKLVRLKLGQDVIDNSNFDFGKVVREFPSEFEEKAKLFLKDPIFSISTNQWRNISAHKSFVINKGNVIITYGRSNIQTRSISYDDCNKIREWTQNIYRAIRFGQVLTDINYLEDIVKELDGSENLKVRFESALMHIIHNMQIVGFKFASTEKLQNIFCLNLIGKANHDVKSSVIHASQCLDQLSCAIYDDEFTKDDFEFTRINIVDNNSKKLASATIPIDIALMKVNRKITLKEYLDKMKFV